MLEKLFINLIGISLTTSAVIILLKLTAGLFQKKYAAKWKYWIWLVLALRLVMPLNFSLTSPPIALDIPNVTMARSLNNGQVELKTHLIPVKIGEGKIKSVGNREKVINNQVFSSSTKSFTLINILMGLWVIGGVLFFIYQFIGYILFRRKVLRWSKEPKDTQIIKILNEVAVDMGLNKKVTLLISKGISSPLMTGFIKPLLILPHEGYIKTDIKFILRHELTHYKRRDLWYKLFLVFVNGVHWFNPFAYLLFHEASADLELSCDDQVINGLSQDERRRYSETILAAISREKSGQTALSTYFYGGQKTMYCRLANIFNTQAKGKGGMALLAVILILGLSGALIACQTDVEEDQLLTNLGYTKTLVKEIFDRRTTFSGGQEYMEELAESLPLESYRRYKSFSLETRPAKVINITYEFDDSYTRGGNGIDPFIGVVEVNNVLLLFSAVEDLERVNFFHYDGQELNYTTTYTIDDLIPRFGSIKPQDLNYPDLYQALGSNIQLSEFYFGHYARIYLGVEPESVSYRNEEPHEIREQSDGSTVWIYKEFSIINSVSSDYSENDSGNRALYYFNSPIAEQNDNLTGLYATRFIYGENDVGKTYEDVIRVLGLPSTIKDLGSEKNYIAYALAEGQQRNAYFLFQKDKLIEEGVMYGTDYSILEFE